MLAALAALLPAAAVAAAPGALPAIGPRILTLVASEVAAYRQAESAAAEVLQRGGGGRAEVSTVLLAGEDGERSAREALRGSPDLVIAIGSRAARFAREHGGESPLVYAMVLDPSSIGLPAPGEVPGGRVSGVTMEVEAGRLFDLVVETLPGVRRIGAVYDPAISGQAVRLATKEAAARGLTLVTQAVRSDSEVLPAAGLLAPHVDAVWALSDSTVLTAANARGLILMSLRARKPLFAISEGFVRSGALAALAADPEQVGRRAALIGLKVLEGARRDSIRPESAPELSVFLNRATAEHIGVDLPQGLLSRAKTVYPESP